MNFLDLMAINIRAFGEGAANVDVDDFPAFFAEKMMMDTGIDIKPGFGARDKDSSYQTFFKKKVQGIIDGRQGDGGNFLSELVVNHFHCRMEHFILAQILKDFHSLEGGFDFLFFKITF